MAVAHLQSSMLRWAMARAGVEPGELAQAFKKSPEEVLAWLEGTSAPTFKQAQTIAKRLRIPFGYLFLAEPPEDVLPLPDFRRTHGAELPPPSVDLRDVISDVLRKQDWYRDYRVGDDEPAFPFVGKYSIGAPVTEVASEIANVLEFEEEIRTEAGAADFLRAFVRQVEAVGILVMRNGIVRQATNRALEVEEFRGFSIADPMAPVIFVNNADSNAAQVFTLAHELGHIWIGEGGISDADPSFDPHDSEDIEGYCNEVAGELLLPWSQLAQSWAERTEASEEWIGKVASSFHVSTVMVARQLWAHDAIGQDEFFDFYEQERSKWAQGRTGSGGNYYLSAPIRNSRRLTETVLESVRASDTSIRDASRLLGVKPANFGKLRDSMGVG